MNLDLLSGSFSHNIPLPTPDFSRLFYLWKAGNWARFIRPVFALLFGILFVGVVRGLVKVGYSTTGPFGERFLTFQRRAEGGQTFHATLESCIWV